MSTRFFEIFYNFLFHLNSVQTYAPACTPAHRHFFWDAFFFSSLPLCFVRLGVYAFFFSSLPLCFVRLGVYAFFFSPPTIILTHLGLFQKSFLHRKIFSRKCLKINNFYFYAQLALKSGRFSAYFFPIHPISPKCEAADLLEKFICSQLSPTRNHRGRTRPFSPLQR